MATTDKVKNTAQQAKGKLKETIGRASGDDKLRAEARPTKWRATSSRPVRSSRTRSRSDATQQIEIDVPDIDGQKRRPRLVRQAICSHG